MKDKKIIYIIVGAIIVLALIITLILLNGNKKEEENTEKGDDKKIINILELKEYENFKLDNVKQVSIRKYTMGGMDEQIITSQSEITKLYNLVTSIKLGDETERACEDNTTIYIFETDSESIKVEIECDWLVVGKKRYTIEK